VDGRPAADDLTVVACYRADVSSVRVGEVARRYGETVLLELTGWRRWRSRRNRRFVVVEAVWNAPATDVGATAAAARRGRRSQIRV